MSNRQLVSQISGEHIYLGRLSLPTPSSGSAWILYGRTLIRCSWGTERSFWSRHEVFEQRCRHGKVRICWNFTHPLNDPPRSLTTTLAPRAPKNTAYAFPNPPLAPVTTTVCPSNLSPDMVFIWRSVDGGREERQKMKEPEGLVVPRHGVKAPRSHLSEDGGDLRLAACC